MESQSEDEFITRITRSAIKSIVRCWYSILSCFPFAFAHSSPTQSLLIRSGNKFEILCRENGEIYSVNMEIDFDVGDEEMALVGTCNGLVCLGSISGRLFIIWNPITHEFCKYFDPEISVYLNQRICEEGFSPSYMVSWGFGYVSAVNDYKIIRICKKRFVSSFKVHVYSTKFDKWKLINREVSHHNFSGLVFPGCLRRSGVMVNETLYWMRDIPPVMKGRTRTILSFNLASEIFDTYPRLEEVSNLSTQSSPYVKRINEYFDELFWEGIESSSKYGRLVICDQGNVKMLKSLEETEQIIFSSDWTLSTYYKNLIGFTGIHKISSRQCSSSHPPCLGIIIINPRTLEHSQLMNLERRSEWEIVSYCASLISPYAHVTRSPDNEHKNI